MNEIRILLVEDHPLMRAGIKTLIHANSQFKVLGEAATIQEAVNITKGQTFDVAIVDISLPDGSGLNFVRMFSVVQPQCKCIMLTMHNEEPYLERALEIGAWGFVVKDMVPERLIETINRVCQGEKSFSKISDSKKNNDKINLSWKTKNLEVKLSHREKLVLEKLIKGLSIQEISENLDINLKTVFTYKLRIQKKLGLDSPSELQKMIFDQSEELLKLII